MLGSGEKRRELQNLFRALAPSPTPPQVRGPALDITYDTHSMPRRQREGKHTGTRVQPKRFSNLEFGYKAAKGLSTYLSTRRMV